MSTEKERKIKHPFINTIATDLDIDTAVEKALYILIKKEYPEIYPHISIFAARHKEKKYKFASVKFMYHDPIANLFTTFTIILNTADICHFYNQEENHWYDNVTQKTVDQYLKIIPEDKEDLFADFANFMMRFGKHNKYKYANIIFNLLSGASLGSAWAASANKLIMDKHNENINAEISGTTTKEED